MILIKKAYPAMQPNKPFRICFYATPVRLAIVMQKIESLTMTHCFLSLIGTETAPGSLPVQCPPVSLTSS